MTTPSDPTSVRHSVHTLNTCYELLPQESYVLEPALPPHAGDLLSQLREMNHYETQFSRFYWILLGEGQRCAPGNASPTVAGHNRAGGALTDTDNRGPARGPELVSPTVTLWLPEYLKKRRKPSGYSAEDCVEVMQPLRMACLEVLKIADMATDVAKVFATIDIDHVEYLLKYPEDLRSTLQGIVKGMNEELLPGVNLPDLAQLPLFFDDMPPDNFSEYSQLSED